MLAKIIKWIYEVISRVTPLLPVSLSVDGNFSPASRPESGSGSSTSSFCSDEFEALCVASLSSKGFFDSEGFAMGFEGGFDLFWSADLSEDTY